MSEAIRTTVKAPEKKIENQVSQVRKGNLYKPLSSPVEQILFLQRTIGNQAVQRLMKSGALQAKLRIGAPGDVYEREADRVADAVMRMPQPQAVSSGTPSIQRACPKCENDELKRQPIKEEGTETAIYTIPTEYSFDARVSPSGGTLIYRYFTSEIRVILEVSPEVRIAKAPFAYQFLTSFEKRDYPIIRLVVAPGVSIRTEGYPELCILGPKYPSLEIYRVQDPALVPLQGDPVIPSHYVGMQPVYGVAGPPPLVVKKRPDGIDIIHTASGDVFEITAPSFLGTARFAYELIPANPLALSYPKNVSIIKVVKTPSTKFFVNRATEAQTPKQEVVLGNIELADPILEVYEVPSVTQVPVQGTSIKPVGRQLTTFEATYYEPNEQIFAKAITDTAIGLIPVVGDLTDIAEFFYGIFEGYDKWGRPLTGTDLVLMGIGALLPLAGGGALRGATRIAKSIGRHPDEIADIVKAASNLTQAERSRISSWTLLIRQGGEIPAEELNKAELIIRRMDEFASAGVREVEPVAVTARETFSPMYEQLIKAGYKPMGPSKAIWPDARYPTVEIRPKGDIFGNYDEVLNYVRETGLTGRRGIDESTIEAHHLLEDRLMEYFGIPTAKGRSVALEAGDHAYFSAEVPSHLPRKTFFDINDVFDAHAQVYREAGHEEWIDEIRNFLRQNKDFIRYRYEITGLIPGSYLPDFVERRRIALEFLDGL
ncbi:MAG: hypothetical protein O8C66_14255 [Candidatus Methanoperedens sp.]|nr:hypothetical protein [Candidatus Methanoperedens sp.]MCZ7371662.1 hypothetical protein [Candidatus Methanoperedens sp.]